MVDTQQRIEIGKRLSELINELGMNNLSFGELVTVDNSTIGKMRKGIVPPTIELILEIYSKRQVSAEWLLFGAGAMFIKEKSGASQQPDQTLLTQMKKQVDELKINFDKLLGVAQEPTSKKKERSLVFEKLTGDKKKGKIDKQ